MSSHAAACRSLACVAVLLLAVPAAWAGPPTGVIYFKDGYAIKGKVGQPHETFIDPYSHSSISVAKGFYLLDDTCRYFFFSHVYVDRADPRPADFGKSIIRKKLHKFVGPAALPPIRQVVEVGDWTDGWDRSYEYLKPGSDKPVKLSQHLFDLNPYYAQVNANSVDHVDPNKFYYYPWSSFYRTRELGPDVVANLMTREQQATRGPAKTDEERVKRRLEIFNFFVQTGWMDEAEKELARLRKDFPKEKGTLDTAAEGIKKLSAMDRLDAIKQALAAGRHEAAQAMLAKFPTDSGDDQMQAEVRTLKVRYDNAATALKKAKALLEKLPKEVGVGDDPKLFAEAAAAISAELSIEHCLKKGDNDEGRLERFLTQADQAERFAKMKLEHLKASQLLSLAVTSWLLGPASAESKPETAIRVWNARRFVMKYLKTEDAGEREKLLKDYQEAKPLTVPEIAQLIPNLPPIDPPAKITTAETTMTVGGGTKGTKYQLKLPPDYHPGRAYPVLIALHHSGESGQDMVKRWGDEAGQWGYILACPNWGAGPYSYSVAEHAVVLETLRDLRQHFHVDSDRVFLTGFGEGGNMVWDVGLSHPNLFAGVAPIAGQPRHQAKIYWTNVMEVPFYVVWGEYMGGPDLTRPDKEDANVVNFNQFKDEWIPAAPRPSACCIGAAGWSGSPPR